MQIIDTSLMWNSHFLMSSSVQVKLRWWTINQVGLVFPSTQCSGQVPSTFKWVFPKIGKTLLKLLKWMIWGYHHFRKPPNIHDIFHPNTTPLGEPKEPWEIRPVRPWTSLRFHRTIGGGIPAESRKEWILKRKKQFGEGLWTLKKKLFNNQKRARWFSWRQKFSSRKPLVFLGFLGGSHEGF